MIGVSYNVKSDKFIKVKWTPKYTTYTVDYDLNWSLTVEVLVCDICEKIEYLYIMSTSSMFLALNVKAGTNLARRFDTLKKTY